jgi:hypothetical protein
MAVKSVPLSRRYRNKQPPSGRGWAHELKHDGYRRDGRVRLYTINGATC